MAVRLSPHTSCGCRLAPHQPLHRAPHQRTHAFHPPLRQPAQHPKPILLPVHPHASVLRQRGQALGPHGPRVSGPEPRPRVAVFEMAVFDPVAVAVFHAVFDFAEGGDAERGEDGVVAEGEAGGEGDGGRGG